MKLTRKKTAIICGICIIGSIGLFLILNTKENDAYQYYGQKVSDITKEAWNVNRYSGIVQTQNTENYTLQSDKKVIETYVHKGDKVNAGDPLFKYDVSQASQSIVNTNLEIEGIMQTIQILKKEIHELNQQLQDAEGEEGVQIKSEISDKQLEIKQQEYDIQAKQNEIKNFQEEVNQSIVKSNIKGIVQSVNDQTIEESNSQNAYLTIIQDEKYVVKGMIDEISMGTLNEGDAVIIRSRTNQDQIWDGKISKIEMNQEKKDEEDSQDSSAQQASKYPFYVELEHNNQLMLGQHVYIEPDIGQKDKLSNIWLDQGFVIKESKNKHYVWLVKDNKVQKQTIKIGQKDEANGIVEIDSGLKKKDYIVWPNKSIKVGDKVQLQ